MLQVFMFDNISGAHSSQIFICNLISSLVLFLFFLQELIQMKYFGVRYYLQDVYNIIDLLFFPTQIIYFILKASDDGYSLPYLANNPEIHGGGELKYTGEYALGKVVTIAVLNVFLIIGILIKITYFMQVNEELGIFIRLVTLTIWQSSYFIVFYNLCILAIGIIFKLAGFEIEN